MTKMTPLTKLESFGQSIWLDYIHRDLTRSGGLKRFVDAGWLRGVTSNPKIFDTAIAESKTYDEDIDRMRNEGMPVEELYLKLVVQDVREAADVLRPVYDGTDGADGFVSLEVSPHIARDADASVSEARRLWEIVDRPNLLVKIPGTPECVQAVRQCLTEGININVTLLFGLEEYRAVAEAYLEALEARAAAGEPLRRVTSVASFFLSRIDVLVDPMLEDIAGGSRHAETAAALTGEVAIASAKAAYLLYRNMFGEKRFARLRERGARVQRLLWASTSTKNPAYSDVKYVEPLIGPDTVNTMPLDTIAAYRDHGRPAARLEEDAEHAARQLDLLATVGIHLEDVTRQLIGEGIQKFIEPYDDLMARLAGKEAGV